MALNQEMDVLFVLLAESSNYILMLSGCIFGLFIGIPKYKEGKISIWHTLLGTFIPILIGLSMMVSQTSVLEFLVKTVTMTSDFVRNGLY